MGMFASNIIAQPVIRTQKEIGGSGYDELRCILKTKNGGMIAGGSSYFNKSGQKTQNIMGKNDYWVVKMDMHGKN